MTASAAQSHAASFWPDRLDKLGVLIAIASTWAMLAAPFATMRPNRIVQGQAVAAWAALPAAAGWLLALVVFMGCAVAMFRTPTMLRLLAGLVALVALGVCIGLAAGHLTPDGNTYARVSPAYGFWVLAFVFALMVADAMTRLRLGPVVRVAMLGAAVFVLAIASRSGLWDQLSILKEYATRADLFRTELGRHLLLALGSLLAAAVVGLPLGVACHRIAAIRAPLLNGLNIVQTVPSIALFGLLIGPLAWIAAHVPGAAALGVRGIGSAPAFVALFLYSLLPLAANTVVGLAGVPRQANDAARGMGMTDWQRLEKVELPLALPVILTGIRIVLVQNIGLATIAALIGGGGLGVFVFQGIGQTAMDLVLLGAVPTVAMAFAAAVLLDAAIEIAGRTGETS